MQHFGLQTSGRLTNLNTYRLLRKDQGFLHRCSATGAPDTEWKLRASPPIHHRDTEEHLEGWEALTYRRRMWRKMTKSTKLTSIFISGAGNIHGGLQLNPQHFSEPAPERAEQLSPETRHNYCNLHSSSIVFVFTIAIKQSIWPCIGLCTQHLTAQTHHDILLWHK